jgi:hypothetical protein
MHMLVSAFRDTTTDDGKVFLLVRTWRVSVNKGGLAGFQFTIADDAGFLLLCHCVSLVVALTVVRA